ncbi:MAG: hypothetical protein AVDCRST_MAG27-1393 [uncultured Craurococcus sp.]|uniref:Uncharacterized protein n=1 Tax=uncultured Craurococcus sp. TaxID=1135998 RepID=A0A6J4HZS6_9PROT|nr:MAG: hypothetical protein AVDCRST_MAG27-1393 [uncultured Craurococcus sp.]
MTPHPSPVQDRGGIPAIDGTNDAEPRDAREMGMVGATGFEPMTR